MAVPKGETSLILTPGQIQVRVSLFYATSKKAYAKHHFVGYNPSIPSIYPIIGQVDHGRGPQR